MTEKPRGDEEIVAAPTAEDPGTADGVGEHAVEGLGHDGVRRIDGRFGDLEADAGDDVQPEPESSSDGDGSWTADPITADPDEDRSVDAVIERGASG